MYCKFLRCPLASVCVGAFFSGCASGPLDLPAANFDRPPAESTQSDRPWSYRQADDAELPSLDVNARLADFVRYAELRNAGLAARFQAWRAAVERVPQAGALPDPRLTLGTYLGEVETRVGAMQNMVSVSQTLPWFGKLRDRSSVAAQNALAAFQRFEQTRLTVRYQVEQAYNRVYYIDRAVEVTRDNLDLIEQFERVVRARYQVAAAGHPDLIRVQVEAGKLEDRLAQLQDLRGTVVAELNAALNRDPSAEVARINSISDRESQATVEQLVSVLIEHNPELRALAQEIERDRIATDLAHKDGYPDVTLGLAYTAVAERSGLNIAENGDDATLATVSLNLPVWREKYDAKVREAVARRLATAHQREELKNQLASTLRKAIFDHQDARRRVELFEKTLIPKATESLDAYLTAFTQGTASFLDLIDAQRTLLGFELELERACADRASSYAHIEQLIGTQLTGLGENAGGGQP